MSVRTADVLSDAATFDNLLLPPRIIKNLTDAGYHRPSPIQQAAIPLARLGTDVIVQAKAGTGKTLVFAIAAVERVDKSNPFPQVLILAPTREVALQAADGIADAAGTLPVSVATFIGGLPTAEDERVLRRKCHVVVGTPGRISALIQRGSLITKAITLLALDEADRLLVEGQGLGTEVQKIIATLPTTRQVLALSATYSQHALHVLRELMHRPQEVRLSADTTELLGVAHFYLMTNESNTAAAAAAETLVNTSSSNINKHPSKSDAKRQALRHLLSSGRFHQAVVFCGSKAAADDLADDLSHAGHAVAALSSAKEQLERIQILNSLRNFTLRVVVATDLAARGIDLEKVNLVVNYDVPAEHATLAHRVGRAGRFGTRGAAVSLVYGDEELAALQHAVKAAQGGQVRKLPYPLPSGWAPDKALEFDDDGDSMGKEEGSKSGVMSQGQEQKVQITSSDIVASLQQVSTGSALAPPPPPPPGNIAANDNIADVLLRASLWPDQLDTPLSKTDTWPLTLEDIGQGVLYAATQSIPAGGGGATMATTVEIDKLLLSDDDDQEEEEGYLDMLENTVEENAADDEVDLRYIVLPSANSPAIVTRRHFAKIVKSAQLDLLRTLESENESLKVLQDAFEQHLQEDEAQEQVAEVSVAHGALLPEQTSPLAAAAGAAPRRRRALGTAQAVAYSKQVIEEDQLAAEAAALEAMLLGYGEEEDVEEQQQREDNNDGYNIVVEGQTGDWSSDFTILPDEGAYVRVPAAFLQKLLLLQQQQQQQNNQEQWR